MSIIMPCAGGEEVTRICLETVSRFTSWPYEFIAINNGCRDDTPAILGAFEREKNTARKGYLCIRNPRNEGFVRATNQGLRAAHGHYVLLLNNDVAVPSGWIEGLVEAIEGSPHYGLAGPLSNCAAAPQLIQNTGYTDFFGFLNFAKKIAASVRNTSEVYRLSGFCLLIKRQVIDVTGLLDERFGIGLFDDDDLCFRARQAGYGLVLAKRVFVHHQGSHTFRLLNIDTEKLLEKNKVVFIRKWKREQGRQQ